MALTQEELSHGFPGMTPFTGLAPLGYYRDWMGMLISGEFQSVALPPEPLFCTPGYPLANEEYWEWLDIISAVRGAEGGFLMMEIGAGYGRWCLAAEGVVRMLRPEIDRRYVAVEGEPTHFRWLKQAFEENEIPSARCDLVNAAVAAEAGVVSFAVGDPKDWYGQSIMPNGRDSETVDIQAILLSKLIKDQGKVVDLIDVDIQGFEFSVLQEAILELRSQVKLVHIGTHSQEIEAGLRELFQRAGWICDFDFPCLGENTTPLGLVSFEDGVQAWRNPVLCPDRT